MLPTIVSPPLIQPNANLYFLSWFNSCLPCSQGFDQHTLGSSPRYATNLRFCLGSDHTLGQHGVGDLQEPGDVRAGLQVRVILLCRLPQPATHMHQRSIST